jgi:hypothetical protein
VNPVPVTLAPERVTLAVPEFISVTVELPVLPTLTFPKLTVDGLAPICPSVPVPDIVTVADGSVLPTCPETSTVPDVLPVVVGVNATVKVVLWPAASVIGVVKPVTENSAPVRVMEFTVMDSSPEFVSVTACLLVAPSDVLPKVMTEGLVVNVAVEAMAVPVRAKACGEPGTLSAKLIVPLSVAAAGGVKTTLKVMLWPAAIDAVPDRPFVPKPVPVTLAALSVSAAFPPLEIVTGCELDLPAMMLLKVTEAGDIEKRGPEPVPETPTAICGLEESLDTERVPVTSPGVCGAN